jgi:hypothetical protein
MRVGVSHRKTWMGPHGLKVGIIRFSKFCCRYAHLASEGVLKVRRILFS